MSNLLLWMVPYWSWDCVVELCAYAVVCGTCLALGYWGVLKNLEDMWNE